MTNSYTDKMATEFVTVDTNRPYELNRDELASLMQIRNEELKILLERCHENLEGLCLKVKSHPLEGITEVASEIATRKVVYGSNTLPTKKPESFLRLLWLAFKEPILIMLVIAAAVSFAIALWTIFRPGTDELMQYGWVRSVAIMTAVAINAVVTAGNIYRKEKQFRALRGQIDSRQTVTVIRNGNLKQISADALLVGDVCALKDGDVVQADGLLLRSDDLTVDESVLTGESDPVKKHVEGDIRLLSGTHVMEGTGKFLVLAVGLSSNTGQMYKLMGQTMEEQSNKKRAERRRAEWSSSCTSDTCRNQSAADLTDLNRSVEVPIVHPQYSLLHDKITLISMRIAKGGLIFAILVSLILIVRFCVRQYVTDRRAWSTADDMSEILNAVIIGITLLVVIIPAGLPLAVSLTLAVSAKKMMKDNNLVRHLYACETMGYATSICSDKTGTLTSNRMIVSQVYIGGQTYYDKPPKNFLDSRLRDLVSVGISVNSSYSSNIQTPGDKASLIQTGNRTEASLLTFVNEMGFDYKQIRLRHPEESFAKVYTFNSFRKCMSTIIQVDMGYRVFCKGAAEIVIDKCNYAMTETGEAEVLDESDKALIQQRVVTTMAVTGLRTICLAYKDIPSSSANDRPNFADNVISGLTMLAIFGIEDPVRSEVPKAIEQCKKAGVVVRMITGDNVRTAVQVATKCGIISPNGNTKDIVMESREFNKRIRDPCGSVDQAKLDKIWPTLRVLARATPKDKFVLVDGMIRSKKSGEREVVAVTGDGTNDAPALRRADVGFAMGIDGTEVAKEAADIILTDDNFTSIVRACMWGRGIYDNICKFLQFQLTVNLVVLGISLIGASALGSAPLEAVPMLWINVIQDTMASLALATEPPNEELLERKPYPRNKNILSTIMLRNIISQSIYQLTVLFVIVFGRRKVLFFLGSQLDTKTDLDTLSFNALVMMSIVNLINSRCVLNERNVFRDIFRNRVFIFMILVMTGIQAVVVEFGGPAFLTVGLNWREWLFCIIVGLGSLLWYQLTVCMMPNEVFHQRLKPSRDITGATAIS